MIDVTDEVVALTVRDETRAAAEASAAEVDGHLARLEDLPCETAEQEAAIGQVLQYVKTRWREIEEQRTSITRPLNAAKRSVDALFSPALRGWKQAEVVLKRKLSEAARLRAEANRAALAAAAAAPAQASTALATVEHRPPPAGVSMTPRWAWEIVDIAQVPARYLQVNGSALARDLAPHRHAEEPPSIPGLRLYKTFDASVRT